MDQIEMLIAQGLDPSAALAPVDLDGDGATDWHVVADEPRVEIHGGPGERLVAVDADSDGDWEALAHDQDGDGRAEVAIRDHDGDGVLEDVQAGLPPQLAFGGGEMLGR